MRGSVTRSASVAYHADSHPVYCNQSAVSRHGQFEKSIPNMEKDGMKAGKADWKRDDIAVPSSGPRDRQIDIPIAIAR